MKRATLKDVAREAGVSHITVSRVVRGVEVVKWETLKRVREALQRLDYRPDPMLSALAAYRSGQGDSPSGQVIAFLEGEKTEYSRIVLEGAGHEARLLGYGMEHFALPMDGRAQLNLSRTLFYRGIKGLLFGPTSEPFDFVGWDWERFAAVSLGALSHRPALHSVAIDYFYGAVTACDLLRGRGCRRLGLVIDARLEARTGHRWLGGYLASLDAREKKMIYSRNDAKSVTEWARQNKVDGVLTIHAEVTQALASMGIHAMHLNDIHRVGGVPYCSLEPGKIGEEGVRLLHPLLMKNEGGLPAEPKVVSLRGVWRDG